MSRWLPFVVLFWLAAPSSAQPAADARTPVESERESQAESRTDSDATRARALFERGLALAQEGRDAEAAEAFEASYAGVPRASTALNWAIVLHRLGRGRDALRALDAFEAERAHATETDVADAEALRQRLRALLATLTLRVEPADARVEIDGRPEPGVGAERLVPLDPGPHVVRVEAPGHLPRRATWTVAAGEALAQSITLHPVAPESVAATERPVESLDPRRPLRRGLAIAGVLVVVAAIVGVVFAATRPASPNGGDTDVVLRPFE
ncbi:MAG: PEGA domain-containing protein [Sandaracinus sp.]|nr:PEGA domain-containing protein [Sandaracinus sp.]MCB9613539.1 PEGA domain-containing protein [Sandaracinus sp.]MCB9619697.1 PEGA domain-containing protein [Sandaracinus sp.]